MKFQSKYDVGQMVYLVHDPDQQPWQIIAITFGAGKEVYHLKQSIIETDAFYYELSTTEDVLVKTNKQKREN